MGLRVTTNVPSMVAQRNLENQSRETDKSYARLSSGNRISSAGDDAAGLAIGTNLNAEVKSLQVAQRNANDAVSIAQTAEGSLNEVSNIIVRLRELSVQAASDTIGDDERKMVAKEYDSLKTEVNRISESTNFNGKKLLDGSGGTLDFQIGSKNGKGDRISFDTSSTNSSASALGFSGTDVSSKGGAQDSMASLDEALSKVNGYRASLGSLQNRLSSAANNVAGQVESLSDAKSRIMDTDIAEESSKVAKNNILRNAGVSVLAQANQAPSNVTKLL
jgi:flagellin